MDYVRTQPVVPVPFSVHIRNPPLVKVVSMLRVFLIVAVVASLAAADCSSSAYYNCATCTNSNSGRCGWDAQNKSCTQGTPFGPGDDTSSPLNWFWTMDSCCGSNTDCASCLSDSGTASQRCGWNPLSSSCDYGTIVGPRGQATPSWNWQWTSNQCSGEDSSSSAMCEDNYDCADCLATGGCGWDGDADSCVAGNANGPTYGVSGDWKYYRCVNSWAWSWSANSAPMWVTWSAIVFFVATLSMCIRRRRRLRATAVMMNGPTTSAPLVQGTQAGAYQSAPPKNDLYGSAGQAEGV